MKTELNQSMSIFELPYIYMRKKDRETSGEKKEIHRSACDRTYTAGYFDQGADERHTGAGRGTGKEWVENGK